MSERLHGYGNELLLGGWAKLMIAYAACLHLTWGIMLLVDQVAANATPLHTLSRATHGSTTLGFALLAVGLLALVAILSPGKYRIALTLPQQLALLIGAAGALSAIIHSHYADGVPRPLLFIAADQLPALLVAVFHTAALLNPAARR